MNNFDPYGLYNNIPKNNMDLYDNQDFDDFYNAKVYNHPDKQFFNKENKNLIIIRIFNEIITYHGKNCLF